MESTSHPRAGVPKLHREIRLMIWTQLYQDQDARLVEIRSIKDCDNHDGPCPRYSPTPPPAVVNICHEARSDALQIARQAGHLLFFDTQPDLSPIYFNPAIDTLYVRNEKSVWIRDFRPVGILTQLYQVHWHSGQLRSLAIELEPVNRATSGHMMEKDLRRFRDLKELVFVARELNDEVLETFKSLRECLRMLHVGCEYAGQHGRLFTPPALQVQDCKLAVRSKCHLSIVEELAS